MSTNNNSAPKANPTVVLIVSASMGVLAMAGGVFLTLRGDTALGSAMIGAVIAAFFQHATQTLSTSSSITAAESITNAIISAVESGATASTGKSALDTSLSRTVGNVSSTSTTPAGSGSSASSSSSSMGG